MFVEFTHINAETGVEISLNTLQFPFTQQLDTHCEMSDRPKTAKALAPGQSPVFTFARNRIWHAEGDIIGKTMAEYDSLRLRLLNLILPSPAPTVRFTGIIKVSDENDNWYTSIVTLTSYSVPVVPLYPAVGAYMFEWESDDPFVYNFVTGEPTYI